MKQRIPPVILAEQQVAHTQRDSKLLEWQKVKRPRNEHINKDICSKVSEHILPTPTLYSQIQVPWDSSPSGTMRPSTNGSVTVENEAKLCKERIIEALGWALKAITNVTTLTFGHEHRMR
jgi:hypothetical protein